jgi:hypothetical protein
MKFLFNNFAGKIMVDFPPDLVPLNNGQFKKQRQFVVEAPSLNIYTMSNQEGGFIVAFA